MQEMNYESESNAAVNPMMIAGLAALVAIIGFGAWFTLNKRPAETAPAMNVTTAASTRPVATDATDTTRAEEVPPTDTSAAGGTMLADSEVTKVELEAGSFYYAPDTIRVKKGETVRIVMTSKDMMHDFNIDELDVKLPITKSGETNTIDFKATKTGTFEYYCSVGQHRVNGQVGKLIVE